MKQIELVRKINKFGAGTWIDQFSLVISSTSLLVSLYILVNILIALYDKEKRIVIIGAMFLSLVIHGLLHEILIKRLLRSVLFIKRPYLTDSNITPIGAKFSDSTFPSGHMSIITSALTVVIYYHPNFWPFALLFLLLTGFSRMHNGYHYLIDIIFGFIFGIGYGFLAMFLFTKMQNIVGF